MKPAFDYRSFILAAFVAMVISPSTGLFSAFAGEACKGKTLVVFGDSLVAGFGLAPGDAFPEQLATRLGETEYEIEIRNAGVSGDTTSGGLSRLDWSVGSDTDAVLLELGANDALRGIPVEVTEKNLDKIIGNLKARNIKVLLAGMLAPPNMGKAYGEAFNAIYARLANKHDIMLYPFFLEGVAAVSELNQEDGIHPNREGIAKIVENIEPVVIEFLDTVC